jgi:hypothetical protein
MMHSVGWSAGFIIGSVMNPNTLLRHVRYSYRPLRLPHARLSTKPAMC